jgi:hypothetical protein
VSISPFRTVDIDGKPKPPPETDNDNDNDNAIESDSMFHRYLTTSKKRNLINRRSHLSADGWDHFTENER